MSRAKPPGPSPPPVAVGNDVVDLAHPRCRDMPLDGRFVDRVCADSERAALRDAREPRRALWLIWAAKEAAYKAVSKRRGVPPPFVHTSFVVRIDGDGRGSVAYEEARIPFREEPGSEPSALHVVAWLPGGPATIDAQVEPVPTEEPPLRELGSRERKAVHSAPSAWVRIGARSRASALLDEPWSDLEIVCGPGPRGRAAPYLRLRGQSTEWDVSLSHHGRFIGWALARPTPASEHGAADPDRRGEGIGHEEA